MKSNENISLTAYRVLLILQKLKQNPADEAEINEYLKNDLKIARSVSRDTIWLYINTLREFGCEIERPSKKNNFKYVLKDHPLKLELTYQEINALIQAKKYMSNELDWENSNNFNKFLSKVNEILPINNQNLINYLKLFSREIDYSEKKDMIDMLNGCCQENKTIIVSYSSTNRKSKIIIIAESLLYENDALYLWGFNPELNDYQYLRVDRIEHFEIDSVQNSYSKTNSKKAIYKIYKPTASSYYLDTNESIIEQDDSGITIETYYKSKFKFIQKILSFGKDCIIIEPPALVEEIKKQLKRMADKYSIDP